jgi:D-alanine-D-alanine ligase
VAARVKSPPPMKKLRVLVLMHDYLVPPDDVSNVNLAEAEWRTEYDVLSTLRGIGHDTRTLAIKDSLGVVSDAVREFKPHVAFNMLENLHEVLSFDQNVVSFLEVLGVPYTGCNPRGLILSRDKALSKMLMAHHRLPIPEYTVIRTGRAVHRPKRLVFPLIVKSLTMDASIGISQASVVHDDGHLQERVKFVHKSIGTDALVERYVEGRELYVGILGNQRLQVFPIWELRFTKSPEGVYPIATERVKWNTRHQKRHGIQTGLAQDLSEELTARIQKICRRVYRTLDLNGYARVDLRLTPNGDIAVLEANANPHLAHDEDFAASAAHAGVPYDMLLQRIIGAGMAWRPEKRG